MKEWVVVLVMVATFAAGAAAQTPVVPLRDRPTQAATGTGRIRGRVVAADTGAPLRRAQVRLASWELRVFRIVSTDAEGQFNVTDLPAGSYGLTVTRNGYASLQFGQQRPFEPGRPLDIANGQLIDHVDFALPRGGLIGGRVTDLLTASNTALDAAGRFRIVGVRGKVRVGGGGGGWFTKRVLLKGNDVTTGFDVSGDVDGIEVVLTDRATTVTGTVRDAVGNSRNDFIVAFFPIGQFDREERGSRQRTIRPDLDGVYRIRNLPPGDYLAAAVPAISLPIEGEWDPAFFARVRPGAISLN